MISVSSQQLPSIFYLGARHHVCCQEGMFISSQIVGHQSVHYLINQTPFPLLSNKSPLELLHKQKPTYSHL